MSATTSAATGRCFGIQRVCQVWERSRSALYARRARAHHHRLGAGPARRGAPPRQSDAQLLAAIRTDLARSPFHGEGHRKVVPTKNLIRTVCVTDRAVLGRRTITSVGMADVRSVEVDGRLASFGRSSGRRVSVHGLQAPAIRGCGQAACRW